MLDETVHMIPMDSVVLIAVVVDVNQVVYTKNCCQMQMMLTVGGLRVQTRVAW